MVTDSANQLPDLWDERKASGLDEVERLVYLSNLLGSDPRITNFGGGNTSAKITHNDPLTGEPVEVLWVKGSGGDLGSAKRAGFASLYMDKLDQLRTKYNRGGLHEDDIVPLYRYAVFADNPVACSIDTPLHAFVPAKWVSHLHSDAVIAIAASEDSEALTKEIFGGRLGYLPWKRPGFDLGLMLQRLIEQNPGIEGAMMGSHGFICWADDATTCYKLSLELINIAAAAIAAKGDVKPFGEPAGPKRIADARSAWLKLLPPLRGKVAHQGKRLIACIDQSDAVMDFLAGSHMPELARLGTSCPDHFLRTKIRPLVLPASVLARIDETLDEELERYRGEYAAYYDRCKRADSPEMRNPNPSVVLVPGLGMVSFGKNAQEAKVTGEFYRNAIEVMRGAQTLSRYVSLPEQEAFDIEYWQLEEAKLRRMPPEREFDRQVAVITGGAQGIGFAAARKMLAGGAHVVVLDINEVRLREAVEMLSATGNSRLAVRGVVCDVTQLEAVQNAIDEAILTFGGIDIAVISAGNARRGSILDTTDQDYQFLTDLLVKGYFLSLRSVSNVMAKQGTGGSIVLVASKNGVAVGSNAAVYNAAKAFELHLMRSAACDLAKYGIRVNAINPDAVLQGSAIWSDQWRSETAQLLGIQPDELQEHYRKRSMLGVTVSADDNADAICWLASEQRSSRTTAATIPVDGGVREGILR